MSDLKPVLRFKANSKPYLFFQFVLCVENVLLFGDNFREGATARGLAGSFDFKPHMALQVLFNESITDTSSIVTLSESQCNSLMSSVDHVAKALLADSEDILKSTICAKFSDIGLDWDLQFFKSAEIVFDSFKENFKNSPKFNEMMAMITGTNGKGSIS